MILAEIVAILLPVYFVIAVGWLYARRHTPDMEVANRINMDVFAPALVFHALTGAHLAAASIGPLVGSALVVVLVSGLVALAVARAAGIAARTLLPPTMFNNAGNLGIPLCVLAFGERGLAPAVLLFITEMALHLTLGVRLLDRGASVARLLRTPLLLAAAAGLACTLSGIALPAPLAHGIELLGNVSIPLMLFALGVRLVGIEFGLWRVGLLGALLRPLAGALAAGLALQLFPLPPLHRDVLWLFAVLPPAVMNFMFAERYGQGPAEVAAIVMLGTLVSLPVLALTLALVL